MSAQLMWELDCGADDGPLIGKIASAAPGLEGHVLLADDQLCQIIEVDPHGNVLRAFGQPGEGPEDLPGAFRVFQLNDGRYGACGGAPSLTYTMGGRGRIVMLDGQARPAGTWLGMGELGDLPASTIRDLRGNGRQILVAADGIDFHDGVMIRVQELSLWDAASAERASLHSTRYEEPLRQLKVREKDMFDLFGSGRCDLSPAGAVAFAPQRDTWTVVVRGADGEGYVLWRDHEPVVRSRAEVARIADILDPTGSGEAEAEEPAIGRVRWLPDGRLWVETVGTLEEPAELARFAEFSSEGEFLRDVSLRWDGFEFGDAWVLMNDGRVAVLRGFNPDEEEEDGSLDRGTVFLLTIS